MQVWTRKCQSISEVLVDDMQSEMFSADVSSTVLQDTVCDYSLWPV